MFLILFVLVVSIIILFNLNVILLCGGVLYFNVLMKNLNLFLIFFCVNFNFLNILF